MDRFLLACPKAPLTSYRKESLKEVFLRTRWQRGGLLYVLPPGSEERYLCLLIKVHLCQTGVLTVKLVFWLEAYFIQTPRLRLTRGRTLETLWHSITGGAWGLILSNKLNVCVTMVSYFHTDHLPRGINRLEPPRSQACVVKVSICKGQSWDLEHTALWWYQNKVLERNLMDGYWL